MSGEHFLQQWNVGKETTEGTPVPTTRKIYVTGTMARQRAANLIKVATGTRDNQRDIHLRAVDVSGTFSAPISSDEILEFLLGSVQGGVTPTQQTVLGAASAPGAATPSASGGTLAAGVYTLAYTETNAVGESLPSATITATTTGTTGSIATPVVTPRSGVTLVKWYMGLVGAPSPLYYTGLSNAGGATVTIVAPTVNTAATPPASVNTSAYLWQFKPAASVDAQTYEWFDGYRGWQQRGSKIEQLKLSGDVKADTKLDVQFYGRESVNSTITPGLSDHVPNFMEGWEVKLYIDAFGATPGTTVVPGTLLNWDVTLKNNIQRKHFGDNTVVAGALPFGELSVQTMLTFEGNAAAFAEYGNWDAGTKRLVRLELGNNGLNIGTSALHPRILIDLPGAWTVEDLTPEDLNTKAYKMTLDYVYDPTNAYGVQISSYSSRAAAYI